MFYYKNSLHIQSQPLLSLLNITQILWEKTLHIVGVTN